MDASNMVPINREGTSLVAGPLSIPVMTDLRSLAELTLESERPNAERVYGAAPPRASEERSLGGCQKLRAVI